MTTDWWQSSSPPFIGLPTCAVCASTGCIKETDRFETRELVPCAKSEGLLTYTKGPILKTEEGRDCAVLCVEEREVIFGEKLIEDDETYDDCRDICSTPRSREGSYMNCNIESCGEVSCRPLDDDAQEGSAEPGPSNSPPLEESEKTKEDCGSEAGSEEEHTSDDLSEQYSHVPGNGNTEVVFARDDVAVWPSRDCKIMGRMSVVKQHDVLFLAWLPSGKGTLNDDGTFRLQSGKDTGTADKEKDSTLYAVHPIPLSDIKAITHHTPHIGWHYLVVVLNSGLTLPPFYFNKGGARSLIKALKEHAEQVLLRSAVDPNTYLINDTADPLQRSLNSVHSESVLVPPSPQTANANPSLMGLSSLSAGFTKITQLAKGKTSSFLGAFENWQGCEDGQPPAAASPSFLLGSILEQPDGCEAVEERTVEPTAKETPSAPNEPASPSTCQPQPSEANTEVGEFEFVDMFQDTSPSSRQCWGPPVCVEQWGTFFDSEGRLVRLDKLKENVFYCGLEPELRKEAWKYLLGVYPPDSTAAERKQLMAQKREEYESLKKQWQSIGEEQEKRFSKWRERKRRVEKDVRRTDRSQHFFRHEHGEPLKALQRVLLTYTMFNFDLGYCQGMSDLASPILYVIMKDVKHKDKERWAAAEADAFWCFAGLMERMEANFHTDQRGMHAQLLALNKFLKLLDPQLYAFFESKDASNFFFCFRWVLIIFKREFLFDDVLRLWEALWTRYKTNYFHLYMCIAVLINHRKEIMGSDFDFDMLLKFCVDLSHKIDLIPTMKLAEVISMHGKQYEQECVAGCN